MTKKNLHRLLVTAIGRGRADVRGTGGRHERRRRLRSDPRQVDHDERRRRLLSGSSRDACPRGSPSQDGRVREQAHRSFADAVLPLRSNSARAASTSAAPRRPSPPTPQHLGEVEEHVAVLAQRVGRSRRARPPRGRTRRACRSRPPGPAPSPGARATRTGRSRRRSPRARPRVAPSARPPHSGPGGTAPLRAAPPASPGGRSPPSP